MRFGYRIHACFAELLHPHSRALAVLRGEIREPEEYGLGHDPVEQWRAMQTRTGACSVCGDIVADGECCDLPCERLPEALNVGAYVEAGLRALSED